MTAHTRILRDGHALRPCTALAGRSVRPPSMHAAQSVHLPCRPLSRRSLRTLCSPSRRDLPLLQTRAHSFAKPSRSASSCFPPAQQCRTQLAMVGEVRMETSHTHGQPLNQVCVCMSMCSCFICRGARKGMCWSCAGMCTGGKPALCQTRNRALSSHARLAYHRPPAVHTCCDAFLKSPMANTCGPKQPQATASALTIKLPPAGARTVQGKE